MSNSLISSAEFHRKLADYFDAEPGVTLMTFDPGTGLRDAMPLRDVNEIAIRALNADFVVFDTGTLEIVSEYYN